MTAALIGVLACASFVVHSMLQACIEALHDDYSGMVAAVRNGAPVNIEEMPLLLRHGFAFGIFEKNAMVIPKRSYKILVAYRCRCEAISHR